MRRLLRVLIEATPEWKYVPLRRFLVFLARSLYPDTQWDVFEPNGEPQPKRHQS